MTVTLGDMLKTVRDYQETLEPGDDPQVRFVVEGREVRFLGFTTETVGGKEVVVMNVEDM